MALTRKHFEELARIAGMVASKEDRLAVTGSLIELCRCENDRFDSDRFYAAVANWAQVYAD